MKNKCCKKIVDSGGGKFSIEQKITIFSYFITGNKLIFLLRGHRLGILYYYYNIVKVTFLTVFGLKPGLGEVTDIFVTIAFRHQQYVGVLWEKRILTFLYYLKIGVNNLYPHTWHSPNAVSMLGQRFRRWPNIQTALGWDDIF